MSRDHKAKRVVNALRRIENDSVPISDMFWTDFIKKSTQLIGHFDPYEYFDLDYVVVSPNSDPHIKEFEILYQSENEVRVRTGFEAVILRKEEFPMPQYESFWIERPEQMEEFYFDDPFDRRRYYTGGDDQINCIGDTFRRNIPSFVERLKPYENSFPIFGSVCEPFEFIWRCLGTENALIWMLENPELFSEFIQRAGNFLIGMTEGQIRAANGKLLGIYIWGDVAYHKGLLFNPLIWRELFKPQLKRIVDVCKKYGLCTIYHCCGNPLQIVEDLAETGIDALHPLEVKAGMSLENIKKKYGSKMSFVGSIDVRVLESGNRKAIKKEVLSKLISSEGVGWICQSDHSVSGNVSLESYSYMVELLRRFGDCPLDMDLLKKEYDSC